MQIVDTHECEDLGDGLLFFKLVGGVNARRHFFIRDIYEKVLGATNAFSTNYQEIGLHIE